ncbi:MAG TPA: helix-turn-helix domain-containing protein, partial [Variovorax sp.]|nr:helix-turn-helix domain-containing protein [Variovorax sp.]
SRHGERSARHDALQRVMRYVREHLHEDMSLQEAAAAAMLSPNYLANLLKKQTDRTFTELVTERRIEQAKELLLVSGATIGAVAAQCGFRDADYFSRRFRQQVGLTPRAFRDKNRI